MPLHWNRAASGSGSDSLAECQVNSDAQVRSASGAIQMTCSLRDAGRLRPMAADSIHGRSMTSRKRSALTGQQYVLFESPTAGRAQ
jgi:hypothetical protein